LAKKLKIKRKELIRLGYPKGKLIAMAINKAQQFYGRSGKEEVLSLLEAVLHAPEKYREDPALGVVASELLDISTTVQSQILLQKNPIHYKTYGVSGIEPGTISQMDTAMRLPITLQGALMPDAHQGYGLPIGGVLATDNAIIPYAVGMDIGCRMCMSVYEIKPSVIGHQGNKLKTILQENTRFGRDEFPNPMDDEILDRTEFKEITFLKPLKDKAWRQIGTSGSGNHFVEFGLLKVDKKNKQLGLDTGEYVAVLSHSGSRGFGASVARHYTQVAMQNCLLPKDAKHLAWLDMDSEAGMEYWLAMNLAGDYASACHAHIHYRIGKALGGQSVATIENHHNFAWKEQLPDGSEVIVHRKGATPAGKGVLGIIPGSMTAPAFIVQGKGSALSINSASHGAGRKMSRTKARKSISQKELSNHLTQQGVTLIGGGLDEAPFAYKDIHQVMNDQKDLVDVLGLFYPKIVRMDR